jgi:murein L,D-transpeptidase YafK
MFRKFAKKLMSRCTLCTTIFVINNMLNLCTTFLLKFPGCAWNVKRKIMEIVVGFLVLLTSCTPQKAAQESQQNCAESVPIPAENNNNLDKSLPRSDVNRDAIQNSKATRPDKILVKKSERTMTLWKRNVCLKTYNVALGGSPVGPKQEEGDKKTPEGVYKISAKNPNGTAGKTLLISYPNDEDRRQAKLAKRNPGGNICIHGLWPSLRSYGADHVKYDWTLGCIAVTDEEIEEIYKVVNVDTTIEIMP